MICSKLNEDAVSADRTLSFTVQNPTDIPVIFSSETPIAAMQSNFIFISAEISTADNLEFPLGCVCTILIPQSFFSFISI